MIFLSKNFSLYVAVSLSNVRFLMIALAYAVPTGVIAGWSGVLDMILTPAKVSQVGQETHTQTAHAHTQNIIILIIILIMLMYIICWKMEAYQ